MGCRIVRKKYSRLTQKLPHYGKYGYLVFKGNVPDNVAKGTWPSSGAGLYHTFKKGFYFLPSKISLIKKSWRPMVSNNP